MEYKKLIEASKKLNKNNDVNTNRIILTNPVEKYNFVIDQYNKDYNIIDNLKLEKIRFDSIYNLGYILENGICSFLILYLAIPSPLLIINKFFLTQSNTNNVIFYILSIYFSMIIFLAFLTLVIYMNARKVFNKNQNLVRNPFMRMIFLPELCRLLNVINKHFHLKETELSIFNFNEFQKEKLPKDELDGKYKFMIYDQNFVDYYSELRNTSLFLRHLFWLLISLAIYTVYYFFIYLI